MIRFRNLVFIGTLMLVASSAGAQTPIVTGEVLLLRGHHGKLVAAQDTQTADWPIRQSETIAYWVFQCGTMGSEIKRNVTFGSTCSLIDQAEGRYALQVGDLVVARKTTAAPPSDWIITDATGVGKAGESVYFGATVLLKNKTSGKYLSANDIEPKLLMSPNTAAWEHWKLLEPPTRMVSLTITPSANGTVICTTLDRNLKCGHLGTNCTGVFPVGTKVILTALAKTGQTFSEWMGACSGLAPSCTLTLSSSAWVIGNFGGSATH